MGCTWSEEFQVVVHQFSPGTRICLCAMEVVPEAESKTAWGRRKNRDEVPEPRTIKRAPKL